jgi:DNA (cytosine-5)-methyltransferase 1
MAFRALSLFSGAGGMDVGMEEAGFRVVAASEMDKHACATFRENHPKTELLEGDLNDNFSKITKYNDIDLVFGGPPCQGFSVAGKMDVSDPRSTLVFSFCDVVEKVRPKAFVMENVAALGRLAKFQFVREEIYKRMSKAGYDVNVFVLNAKDFGVPQSRERVFFVGMLNGFTPICETVFEKFKTEPKTLRQAICHLGKAGSPSNPNITNAKITLALKPVMRRSPYSGMLFNGQGRPLNPDAWSSTLPASMGGNRTPIVDEDHLYDNKPSWVEAYHQKLKSNDIKSEFKEAPSRLRRLTVDEAAILQTFPLSYKFLGPKSRVFSQIGNAVPCKLAEVVALAVKSSLCKELKLEQAGTVERNLELAFT